MASRDELQRMLDVLGGTQEANEIQQEALAVPLSPLEAEQEMIGQKIDEEKTKSKELDLVKEQARNADKEQKIAEAIGKTTAAVDDQETGTAEEAKDFVKKGVAAPVQEVPTEIEKSFKRYKELQAEKPDDTKAAWLDAISSLASGLGSVTGIKTTPTQFAKQARESRKAKMGEQKDLLDLYTKYQKAVGAGGVSSDPNSIKSRHAQNQAMSLMDSLHITYDPKAINQLDASTLSSKNFTAALRKSTNELSNKREGRLERKFGFDKKEKFEKDSRDALKDMRATDSWKMAEKSLSEIPTITTLLDDAYEKGGQSLAMLGPKMARGIANEVGVLTEQDVTRYVKNPSVVGGLIDTIQKAKSGQISEASYENLKRLLTIAKETAKEKMNQAIDRESILFSRREKIDYEDARQFLDSEFIRTKDLQNKEKMDKLLNRYSEKNVLKRLKASTKKSVKSNEVRRRTGDGKIAIFDNVTKKFLRWE